MRKKNLFLCLGLAVPTLATALPSEVMHHPDSTEYLGSVEIVAKRLTKPSSLSKIPAPAREIPVSVTELALPKLQEMNFTDLSEATRDTPGVNAFRDYGAFHMFFIRGFMETIVMQDGIRDDRHALWQSAPITGMSAVEKIEFIKGAASMTVGHSALGGAINVVYKKPTIEKHYNARLSLGSWQTYHAQAGASGSITDRLRYRADAELKTSAGWRDNFTRVANARLALDWVINSGHKLGFIFKGNRDSYGGDYGQPHLGYDLYQVQDDKLVYRRGDLPLNISPKMSYSDPADALHHSSWAGVLRYEGMLGRGWKLSNSLSLSHDNIDYYSTDGISYVEGTGNHYRKEADGTKTLIDINHVQRSAFAFAYPTTSLQNQLELSSNKHWGMTKHALLLGYNFTNLSLNRYDNAEYDALAYDKDGVGGRMPSTDASKRNTGYINWEYKRRQDFRDWVHGVYAQDYMTWGKLNALASLRLDFFHRNFLVNKKIGQSFQRGEGLEISNVALTYRLGLVYNFSKAFNIYASTSNFYKPQRVAFSSEVIYLNSDGREMTVSDLKRLKPSTGVQYEVGMRLDLDKLSLSASAYHISMTNIMKSNLGERDGKTLGGIVGNLASQGVEVDLAYSPVKALDLTLGYALTDARLKASSVKAFASAVKEGNYVERVPRHKFVAWAFGNLPLSSGRFRLGVGVEHSGKSFADESNLYTLPAYTLLNALAVYHQGNWTIQLNAGNLLDKKHYRLALNSTQYIPAPGRNVTLTIGFDL